MIVLTRHDDSTYKLQRRHWEVAMIVLTGRKAACSALLPHYGTTLPLTRAIICHCQAQNDTSGAFFIKAPLFFLLFTLHQIGWNPDKHWGCERWRVTHHSSPLFTFGRRFSIHRFSQISRVKRGWRVVKSRAQLFTRANSLATDIYTISVKSEECFWSCTIKVFREKFWRLGDKVLSLPSDSKTNNQTELW